MQRTTILALAFCAWAGGACANNSAPADTSNPASPTPVVADEASVAASADASCRMVVAVTGMT